MIWPNGYANALAASSTRRRQRQRTRQRPVHRRQRAVHRVGLAAPGPLGLADVVVLRLRHRRHAGLLRGASSAHEFDYRVR